MVGREGELSRLLTLLNDAEAGRAVVALVSGDAGVGKSRLVTEETRLGAGAASPSCPDSAPSSVTACPTCR